MTKIVGGIVGIWILVLSLDYLGDLATLGAQFRVRASEAAFQFAITQSADATARYQQAIAKSQLAGAATSDLATLATLAATAEAAAKAVDVAKYSAEHAARLTNESAEAAAKAVRESRKFPDDSFFYTAGILLIGLISYFGGLALSRNLRGTPGIFEDGDVRFALTCAFVSIFLALLSFYSFTPDEPTPFARSLIESFMSLTVIVVGFYFAATSAIEVAKLREKKRASDAPSGEET